MNKQTNTGEIVIYQAEDGQASLEANLVEDTVWLNQDVPGSLHHSHLYKIPQII